MRGEEFLDHIVNHVQTAMHSPVYTHTHTYTYTMQMQILLLSLGGHAHLAEPGCLNTKQAL